MNNESPIQQKKQQKNKILSWKSKYSNLYEENKKYYKNGIELRHSDNNSAYGKDDFMRTIKEEVSNIINQRFENIVVLIGAGASIIANNDKKGSSGVTVSELATIIHNYLKESSYTFTNSEKKVDVFSLQCMAKICQYSDNIFSSNKTEEFIDDFNLEDLLSNIFAYTKFIEKDKEKYMDTIEAILNIIVNSTSYEFDNTKFKHAKLLNILSNLSKPENKINLVTTNYDTLLEDAAESMKWTVFDGFSFSRIPQFDSTMFDWHLVKQVQGVKTNENIYKNNVVNLLKIHGSITWEISQSGKNIIRKDKNNVKNPLMVFPSSNKYAQSYQEPYFDLFNKFQNILHKPNTLLLTVGFSFADNHIARMIMSAIQTNDSLSTLITDFDINSKNENWTELETAMDNYYNIAFLKATLNGDLTNLIGGNIDDN